MSNLVYLNAFRKIRDKYVLFLFGEPMALTITPTQSLWLIEGKTKNYYELINGRWLLNNDYYRFEVYRKDAVDIIEAFDLSKLKSVVELNIYNDATKAIKE